MNDILTPVLEEAHLRGVLSILGADHDQPLQFHVATERDVEEQLLVGVGYDKLRRGGQRKGRFRRIS